MTKRPDSASISQSSFDFSEGAARPASAPAPSGGASARPSKTTAKPQGPAPRAKAVPPGEDRFLTVQTVAARYEVSVATIWRWAKSRPGFPAGVRLSPEYRTAAPVGIVTPGEIESSSWHRVNDPLIYQWQLYAGHLDVTTTDTYLAVIRDFEQFTGGKPFDQIRVEDAHGSRDHLLSRAGRSKNTGGLSRKTIVKKAGQLAAFFAWVVKQPGYRRQNQMLSDYFRMPRKMLAKGFEPPKRAFPDFADVLPVIAALPGEMKAPRVGRLLNLRQLA